MRRLNEKQKEMLMAHAGKLPLDGIAFYDVAKDKTMSWELYQEIMLLNEFETFNHSVNSFISSLPCSAFKNEGGVNGFILS